MGVRVIALKSSLVNPIGGKLPGTMEAVAHCCHTIYRCAVMKSLFLCLLMMSILKASFYGPRTLPFQRLVSR
jgi:hypothetical protein